MKFKPGQSGNPNGRRAEKPFKDALKIELLAAGDDQKALRAVAAALIKEAQSGNLQAIKELADRTDGKSAQQLTLAGPDDQEGRPTAIQVTYVRPSQS